MIQDIGEHRYHNEYRRIVPEPGSRILGSRGREFLARREGERLSFLTLREVEELFPEMDTGGCIYLFAIDETKYFWLPELDSVVAPGPAQPMSSDGAPSGPAQHASSADSAPGPVQSALSADMGPGSAQQAPSADSAPGPAQPALSADSDPELAQPALSGTLAQPGSAGVVWEKLEWLRTAVPREEAFAGVTGYQLMDWYRSRRFCPRCGQPMQHDERERMMRCPACGQMEYPKISPAIIVAVTDGDRILLTKYAGGAYRKYALIAGFAEIGESIEETVAREVMEEVGLRVKNLRYYKSQPWSFTGTLLFGFFAELDGDDAIRMDRTELSVAEWCTRDEVPEDDGVSLTREMMRVFREGGPRW